MVKKLLLFSILFTLPLIAIAQNENPIPQLFEVVGQDISGQGKSTRSVSDKMSKRANNPMFIEIRKVEFPNLKNLAEEKRMNEQSPAYFQFSIPIGKKAGTGKILAVPKHIEVDKEGNYTYNAELLYKKDLQGDLTLIHQDGKNFGSMTIGERSFKIEHIDGEGEYLIELDTEKLISKEACISMPKKMKKGAPSPPLAVWTKWPTTFLRQEVPPVVHVLLGFSHCSQMQRTMFPTRINSQPLRYPN
ncbi:hypothetical protein [Costertonia aggregata]|uniref:hypothetical protein n=1 Tax=Costertonia aggregata TaxID=343403 RepID=UPI001D146858|nr:hypothetical protein [Costertonia aggregata]